MSFFSKYPSAKPAWKVGERIFLNHLEAQAKQFAAQSDQKVEVWTKSKEEKATRKPDQKKK